MFTQSKTIPTLLALLLLFCATGLYSQADDTLFPARVGDQYGYINRKGQIVIKPQFDSAEKFSDGLALVEQGGKKIDITDGISTRAFGKRSYIDRTGKVVIQLGKMQIAKSFSEGLAAVWMDSPCDRSCYGYIDTTGKVVLPQKYQTAGAFTNGTADVRMADDKWGVIDKSGKFIIPPKYDGVFPFLEGVGIAISIRSKKLNPGDQELSDFAAEFYDIDGTVIGRPESFVFGFFESGLVLTITKSGMGFVDKRGNLVIAPSFEKALGFSDGLCAVRVNKKWGFINPSGKFVIDPTYDSVLPFSEGLARVDVNGKQGYIDTSGNMIIQPQKWEVYQFEDGLADARQNGWRGYIDKTGKFVWKAKDQ